MNEITYFKENWDRSFPNLRSRGELDEENCNYQITLDLKMDNFAALDSRVRNGLAKRGYQLDPAIEERSRLFSLLYMPDREILVPKPGEFSTKEGIYQVTLAPRFEVDARVVPDAKDKKTFEEAIEEECPELEDFKKALASQFAGAVAYDKKSKGNLADRTTLAHAMKGLFLALYDFEKIVIPDYNFDKLNHYLMCMLDRIHAQLKRDRSI